MTITYRGTPYIVRSEVDLQNLLGRLAAEDYRRTRGIVPAWGQTDNPGAKDAWARWMEDLAIVVFGLDRES